MMGDNWVVGALAGALFILVVALMVAAVFDLVRRRKRGAGMELQKDKDGYTLCPKCDLGEDGPCLHDREMFNSKPTTGGELHFGPEVKCDPAIVCVYRNGQRLIQGIEYDFDPEARRFRWVTPPREGDEVFIKADAPESHNIRSEFWLNQGWMAP